MKDKSKVLKTYGYMFYKLQFIELYLTCKVFNSPPLFAL